MELIGEKRTTFGKKTKSLRADRKLPAVIFGKGLESLPISINHLDFVKVLAEAGETNVIDIKIDSVSHPVLIKEVHNHHISDSPMHVGFYQVDLKTKTSANIPVEVINEDKNELVKSGEALVLTLLNEIEVEALPTDLPNKFIIDAEKLINMDVNITLADLDYDRSKVEIIIAEDEELEDIIVAKLDYAVMAEEPEEIVTEEEAMENLEATGEKGKEEEEGAEAETTEDKKPAKE